MGLWVSPDRLVQVRRNRLASMGEERDTNYIDLEIVRGEIAATRQLFEQHDWPSIDVSRRSIEETAAAVMNLLTERREKAVSEKVDPGFGQPLAPGDAQGRGCGFRGAGRCLSTSAPSQGNFFHRAKTPAPSRSLWQSKRRWPSRAKILATWCWAGIRSWRWEGELISKSPDLASLRAELRRLSGKTHHLISAAALARDGARGLASYRPLPA